MMNCAGRRLPSLVADDNPYGPPRLGDLVVGTDRVVGVGPWNNFFEWAAPNPQGITGDMKPRATLGFPGMYMNVVNCVTVCPISSQTLAIHVWG